MGPSLGARLLRHFYAVLIRPPASLRHGAATPIPYSGISRHILLVHRDEASPVSTAQEPFHTAQALLNEPLRPSSANRRAYAPPANASRPTPQTTRILGWSASTSRDSRDDVLSPHLSYREILY
jgi:hypothetical protein